MTIIINILVKIVFTNTSKMNVVLSKREENENNLIFDNETTWSGFKALANRLIAGISLAPKPKIKFNKNNSADIL